MPWNRTRLAGETLRAIMCLRSWLEIKDEEYDILVGHDPENELDSLYH